MKSWRRRLTDLAARLCPAWTLELPRTVVRRIEAASSDSPYGVVLRVRAVPDHRVDSRVEVFARCDGGIEEFADHIGTTCSGGRARHWYARIWTFEVGEPRDGSPA